MQHNPMLGLKWAAMFPEKQKHRPRLWQLRLRYLLVSLMILPLLFSLSNNRRLNGEQVVDVILIGIMLCCTIVLVNQGILWVIETAIRSEINGSIDES